MLLPDCPHQPGHLVHHRKEEPAPLLTVGYVVAFQMDSFYTPEGFGNIGSLPLITCECYRMPTRQQLANDGYASGGVSQPPIQRCNKNMLMSVTTQ